MEHPVQGRGWICFPGWRRRDRTTVWDNHLLPVADRRDRWKSKHPTGLIHSARRDEVSTSFNSWRLFGAFGLMAASGLSAQSFPPNPKVDALYAEWNSTTKPGCALGVI